MVASAVASAIGAIAMAGASAYGSYAQSKAQQNVLGATHAFHDAGGMDLLKAMGSWKKNGKMDWPQILKDLQGLSDNIGEYANSAYNYYLEDQAFQRQVNYNLDAMEKQYQYSLKSMNQQYKYDVDMQNRTFEQSQELQNQQNAWSKMMSDTSHQREVADLRAAGLNPILSTNAGANAYSSGSAVIGGNTPQGSGVSALPVQKPSYANAMQYALEQKRVSNETAETQARINKINQETKNLKNTKEGLIGDVRDLVQGLDYDLDVNGFIKSASNGLTQLVDDFKNNSVFQGLKKLFKFSYGVSPLGLTHNTYNAINDVMGVIKDYRGKSNYDIIHTKNGDLYDVDDYIRSKYGVK